MSYSIQSSTTNTTGVSLPDTFDSDTESLGETRLVSDNRIYLQMGQYPNIDTGPIVHEVPALAFVLYSPQDEEGDWGPWHYIATDIYRTGACYDGFSVALPNGGFAIAYTTSAYYVQFMTQDLRIAIFDAAGNRVGQDLRVDATAAVIDRFTVASDDSLSVLWTSEATGVTWETIAKNGPTSLGSTATLDEDGAHTFSAGDFAFSSETGATFAAVIIKRLPGTGELRFSGTPVRAGDRIEVEDIGKLVWTPDEDAHGENLAELKFRVVDSDGVLSRQHRLAFDVNGVDDAPEAKADRVRAHETGAAIISPLQNDIDDDGDILSVSTVSVIGGDAEARIRNDGRVAVTYTGEDLSLGETARVKVAYTVTDGTATDQATIVVKFKGQAETSRSFFGTTNGDRLAGSGGADLIHGHQQGDVIRGGAGDDFIRGGGGNDRLAGGSGDDALIGGRGRDEFIFDAADKSDDTIADFAPGHDKILLRGFGGMRDFGDIAAGMHAHGGDVVIDLGAAGSITLLSIDRADLDGRDFLL